MQAEPVNWLTIGQAGVMRLDIPVHTIGNGKPVLGITCSVHGNETAGLFIVARVINHLKSSKIVNGTVHIIPAANPAAQFVNSRVAPLDQKDLNRAGRGRADGSFTDRVGAQLFNFLLQCDLVINIHEFEMHTPITAVFMSARNTEVRAKTLKAIRTFSPEIIWVIDTSQNSDVQYQTTLDMALTQSGTVNFPIETTQLPFLTDTEIDKAAQGILRVAGYLGIIKPLIENPSVAVPTFIRHEVTANESGLWESNGILMKSIEAGSQIGTLKTLPDFQQHQVYSPSSGILVQCRHRQLVATGTSLFSIGQPAEQIIASFN